MFKGSSNSRIIKTPEQLALCSQPADIGSDGPLQERWNKLRKKWFPEDAALDDFVVRWSKRSQLRTLASCSVSGKRVTVARELNYPQHSRWLDPLLYHEMCHAALGSGKRSSGRRICHGRLFRALERRHPQTMELDAWIRQGSWLTAVRSDHIRRGRKQSAQRSCRTKRSKPSFWKRVRRIFALSA